MLRTRIMFRFKRKTKKKNKNDLDRKDIKNHEMSEDSWEEDNTHDKHDRDSSISFDDDKESTPSQEDELQDRIDDMKWSTGEPDEKMLTHNITNMIGTQKKTEMTTYPADHHLKSRQMEQKSDPVKSDTCHVDEISK